MAASLCTMHSNSSSQCVSKPSNRGPWRTGSRGHMYQSSASGAQGFLAGAAHDDGADYELPDAQRVVAGLVRRVQRLAGRARRVDAKVGLVADDGLFGHAEAAPDNGRHLLRRRAVIGEPRSDHFRDDAVAPHGMRPVAGLAAGQLQLQGALVLEEPRDEFGPRDLLDVQDAVLGRDAGDE